ncbi:hypothetical protein [Marivita sp. GX14005]|uniref:hypothetical protein n=1 Tax=Marivita sp. GX14005 TaxID=2942276 RepID=UPI002019F30C|nr:hypothetical protein [Marivita sp. GX14005]MCL3881117.1 hypothetical protein [Marivita sp. GX14005]
MFRERPEGQRIDSYTGPYERWIFSEELGRPFAFPAIRSGPSSHITALMEGRGRVESSDTVDVRVPPLWSEAPEITPFAMRDLAEPFGPSIGDTRIARILEALPGARYRLSMPLADATWTGHYDPSARPGGWRPPKRRPKAIIGVIDDAIPFLHRAFRDRDGHSRIAFCWLQAARGAQAAAVPFGRELTNREIDDLHNAHGVREPAAYRAAGAVDRDLPELGTVLAHHASHGAHIMGLAAGNDIRTEAPHLPDDAAIIAVQLPNTIAWDTSGFGKEMMMLSAVEYVFHRARMIAQACDSPELPLVVNFSYGWSANRHDGQSSFERAVESLVSRRKEAQPLTELVMPTGNNFSNRMHAHFGAKDAAEGRHAFGWQVKPNDRTSSYLEIWLPLGFEPDGWRVTVSPPHGVTLSGCGTMEISPDPELTGGDPRRFTELEMPEGNIGQLSADKHQGNRWRVLLALIPTAPSAHISRRAPSGLWTITIDMAGTPLEDGQCLDIWVQRDDDPTQLGTGGQQSYLVDLERPAPPRPLDPPPLRPVRGYGCLNGIGTAPSVFRVAGYVQGSGKPASYSGSASLDVRAEGRALVGLEAPIACAVSDQDAFRPGIPSIGILSGSGARIVGTSAAAALASRRIALNFLRGEAATEGFEHLRSAERDLPLDEAQAYAREGQWRVPHAGPRKPPRAVS